MEKRNRGEKRRNAARITAAGLLGAGLLDAWLATGKSGGSEEDKQIYEQAMAMQGQMDTLGFCNFRLTGCCPERMPMKNVIWTGSVYLKAAVENITVPGWRNVLSWTSLTLTGRIRLILRRG